MNKFSLCLRFLALQGISFYYESSLPDGFVEPRYAKYLWEDFI